MIPSTSLAVSRVRARLSSPLVSSRQCVSPPCADKLTLVHSDRGNARCRLLFEPEHYVDRFVDGFVRGRESRRCCYFCSGYQRSGTRPTYLRATSFELLLNQKTHRLRIPAELAASDCRATRYHPSQWCLSHRRLSERLSSGEQRRDRVQLEFVGVGGTIVDSFFLFPLVRGRYRFLSDRIHCCGFHVQQSANVVVSSAGSGGAVSIDGINSVGIQGNTVSYTFSQQANIGSQDTLLTTVLGGTISLAGKSISSDAEVTTFNALEITNTFSSSASMTASDTLEIEGGGTFC